MPQDQFELISCSHCKADFEFRLLTSCSCCSQGLICRSCKEFADLPKSQCGRCRNVVMVDCEDDGAKCSFCEKYYCKESCTTTCTVCEEAFCRDCSTVNYSNPGSRDVCFDCNDCLAK